MRVYSLNRIKLSLGLLFIVIIIGTFGYMIISNMGIIDALYMTIITIATVGYREVVELDNVGKLFTIFLIIVGTGALAFFATQVVEYIIEGEIRRIFKRNSMNKKIARLRDHYILCGFGRMGRIVAEEFKGKVDFVVIEKSDKFLDYFEENGFYYIIGDATKESVLELAAIKTAKGLISVVNTDAENVYIVLTARMLRKDITIYTRASDEESYKKMLLAGADKVFSPYMIGGKSIANSILRPHVSEFFDFTLNSDLHVDVMEIKVLKGRKLCDKSIAESGIRDYGLIILALKKNDGRIIYNPKAVEIIESGDIIIIIGSVEDCKRFDNFIRGDNVEI
ncbi:MAG: potassium channel family protein [Calditerrivibrio sp.]|nr:potassium channel family protein [Calditerrivibrio sp.]